MRRTAALGGLAALVLAWSWLRLEREPLERGLVFWAALVGIAPALVPARWRLPAAAAAGLVGLRYAFGTPSPGGAWERAVDGFYGYYDVPLPFRPELQPRMHALVVVAILAFSLAVSLAVAYRRALLAATILVAGAAWPATLLTSTNTLSRGAVVLAAALAIVGGLSTAARLRQLGVAVALVVAAAVGIAGIPAVAKGAFLGWETWEPERRTVPTNVRYVWDMSYGPLVWPAKKTTVLSIEAPPVSRYWRATTLDVFTGGGWIDGPKPLSDAPVRDPLLPRVAYRQDRQLRARVEVKALLDESLIGASIPVRYDVEDVEDVVYRPDGTARVLDYVPPGSTYTTWSYVARPDPRALARAPAAYPASLASYREVESRYEQPPTPMFGRPNRRAAMDRYFTENPRVADYRPLYERALEVAGGAPSPYAAVVALETHFRDGQRFAYDEDPTMRGDVPPLVEFVTRTRRGYCQYFAGAMALMLRYLGIPARVGAGFTSGSYDQDDGRWTVVDRDAHTWVEVWFAGVGWLPFDPTPGRGDLDGSYSAASVDFDAAAVTAAIAAGLGAAEFKLGTERFERGSAPGRDAPGRDLPGDIGGAGGRERPESLLRLLAFAAVAGAGAIGLLKLIRRRVRYLTRDPRRVAGAVRRELTEFLADQGVRVDGSATFSDLGEALRVQADVDPERFVDAAQTARYGPPDAADAAARRARRELRRIERGLRRQLSTWERARGLVSLRSLGFG